MCTSAFLSEALHVCSNSFLQPDTVIYRNKNLFFKYGIKYILRGNREQQKFKHEFRWSHKKLMVMKWFGQSI